MLSHFSRVQLFATLWTVAHQTPLSMRFSRQDYWSRLPCPPPGDLPAPGVEPTSLTSPALAGGLFILFFLPLTPPGKALFKSQPSQIAVLIPITVQGLHMFVQVPKLKDLCLTDGFLTFGVGNKPLATTEASPYFTRVANLLWASMGGGKALCAWTCLITSPPHLLSQPVSSLMTYSCKNIFLMFESKSISHRTHNL